MPGLVLPLANGISICYQHAKPITSAGELLAKRKITPGYVFFYILFLPDSWRIVIGVIVSVAATPYIIKPDMTAGAEGMLYIMTATIGYGVSGFAGRRISGFFKKLVLGENRPGRR